MLEENPLDRINLQGKRTRFPIPRRHEAFTCIAGLLGELALTFSEAGAVLQRYDYSPRTTVIDILDLNRGGWRFTRETGVHVRVEKHLGRGIIVNNDLAEDLNGLVEAKERLERTLRGDVIGSLESLVNSKIFK